MKRKKSDNIENKKKKKKDDLPKWNSGFFAPDPIVLSQPAYVQVDRKNWLEDDFIRQYFDDDILQHIVENSNQQYVFKTGKTLGLTLKELKVWLGINFTMSALQILKIRMCWEKGLRLSLIADAMTRDRYFLLRNSLKFVFDNDISDDERKNDRLWKVRPLINRVLEDCQKQPRDQHIAIDEMMIPFSGVCSVKQFVPNKPNPVGLKAFVLANPSGIVCDLVIYQGQNTFPEESSQGFSLCESSVICLARSLVPGHIIYLDRYFTTVKLVEELLKRGIPCTGTIMKNRLPPNTDLPDPKEFKKKVRGSCATVVRPDNAVAVSYWLDNNVVAMISSNEAEEHKKNVKRWSKKEKKYIEIPQAKVINSYNKNMGGIDLADRMLSYCPSRARTKKWTIRCGMHFFDLGLTNAWLEFRDEKRKQKVPKKDIPQFRTFKFEVGRRMIEQNEENSESEWTSSDEEDDVTADGRKTKLPSLLKRKKGAKHLPDVTTGVQKRCRNPKCLKKTSIFCIKCKVYLCLMGGRNCFLKFHT